MASLSFGTKMILIGAIFVLPVALLIVLLHLQIQGDVKFYEQEQLGVNYTRTLRPLFADLEAQRLAGNAPAAQAATRRRVEADFRAAFMHDSGTGGRLKLTASLQALRAGWSQHAESSALLTALIALLGNVSDNSKITLDPMLDGYYIGDTMVNKLPSLIDGVARVGELNQRALFGLYLATDDRIALTILSGQMAAARDGIDHNLPIAVTAAPYLAANVNELRVGLHEETKSAVDWLGTALLKSNMPSGDPADWLAHEKKSLALSFKLYDATIAAMDELLQKRIDALVHREIVIFAIVLAAILVAAALMVVTSRSMSRHLADKISLEHEIVERTAVEKQLAHAAYHDKLTGLLNRASLTNRMNDIVARRNAGDHPWALLFVDLDRFKIVNDSLGHIAGDVVLVEAARRFERCVRSCDTVVRLGGDEFIILIDDIEDIEIAHDIARRALHAFDAPFSVSGREVFASASIGIAISHNGNDRPEDVLRNADIAMYHAKALGKNRYELFTSDLLTSAITRLEVETDLAYALDREELRVVYQPIISLQDGRLSGFEALVRWQHPVRGLVGPDQFISIAEENGAIVAIGEWILRQACRQLAAWRTTLADTQDLRMNVNVSAKQLTHPGFLAIMASAISECSLNADALNMEITESILMENAQLARSLLTSIKEMGVHIHLDDFGTGYSSLAYLRDFPIDALKIDKSFVSSSNAINPEAGLASSEIVRTIIALADSLSLTVTAEGVETDGQRKQLRDLGCTRGQGYFFSRPIDASKAGAFIVARASQTVGHLLDSAANSAMLTTAGRS